MGLKVISLFDGISCGQLALKRADKDVDKYFSSEIDKNAIAITQQHFPDTIQIGDVANVRYENGILFTEKGEYNVGKIDLLIGGSPCTNLSFAGLRYGMMTEGNEEISDLETYITHKANGEIFKGQSHLFFEYLRLLKEINPEYFLLENVNMKIVHKDVITKQVSDVRGVEINPLSINSRLVSAQNRPRIYWSNLVPDKIVDKNIKLKDILTNFPDRCYRWLSPKQMLRLKNHDYKYERMYKILTKDSEKSLCLTTCFLSSDHGKIRIGDKIRFLSIEECELLQTLPYGYTSGISDARRYHAIGNAWTVDVIVEFFKKTGEPIHAQGKPYLTQG